MGWRLFSENYFLILLLNLTCQYATGCIQVMSNNIGGPLMNTPKITAEIKIEQGLPRMYIDGKFTSPLMFFGNTEAEGWHTTLANEIKLAASKGVHLHSFVVHMPVIEEGVTPDFSHLHESFDYFLEADPDALLFPRMFLPFKPLDFWHTEAKDDTITYSDGRLASPSPRRRSGSIRSANLSPQPSTISSPSPPIPSTLSVIT